MRRSRPVLLFAGAILLSAGLLTLRSEAEDPRPVAPKSDSTSAPARPTEMPPIRRIVLPPGQMSTELERLRQGAWMKMLLTDFDTLVRQARAGRQNDVPKPQLLRAFYRAKLSEAPGKDREAGEPHLAGNGLWSVQHAVTQPAVLPLRPLDLAIQQVRFENREAMFGAFSPGGLGVYLDRKGTQDVLFDWTARGERSPEGTHFDWRVPAAPVNVLELELPVGRTVTVTTDSSLVQGPEPASAPDRRFWRVHFPNRSVLHLTINPDDRTSPQLEPLVVEQARGRHTLSPDGENAESVFDIKVATGGMRTLQLTCDPLLRPYKVALGNAGNATLERWEFQPGTQPSSPGTLTLTFREPVAGILQPQIFCRAPLGQPSPSPEHRTWNCPGVRVMGATGTPRTETLEIRCHPQLRLENWESRDFRVTSAETEADGTYRLSLAATGVPSAGKPTDPPYSARPTAQIRTRGVDYRASVQTWWQLEGGKSLATAWITYDVRHGQLFELPLQLGAGWDVEQVDCEPAGRLRNWTVRSGKDNQPGQLLVELNTPLESDNPPRLIVHLRGSRAPQRGQVGWTGSFPLLFPSTAANLEGDLAVGWESALEEAQFSLPFTPVRALAAGPWGKANPQGYFHWRGKPPQGQVTLQPRRAEVVGRTSNEVQLTAEQLDVSARVQATVLAGTLSALDYLLPAETQGPGKWSLAQAPNQSASLQLWAPERRTGAEIAAVLSLLSAGHGLEASVLLTPPFGAQRWRLPLSLPLSAGQRLDLRVDDLHRRSPGTSGSQGWWSVPLVTLPGSEGEVRLTLRSGEVPPDQLRTLGLRERSEPHDANWSEKTHPWRTFTHRGEAISLNLPAVAWSSRQQATSPNPAVVPRASLLALMEPEGRVVQHFRFEVRDWGQPHLPVQMPPGTELIAVRVDGLDATNLISRQGESELEVILPIPASRRPNSSVHYCELLYALPGVTNHLWMRLEAPTPVLPLRPLSFRRVWRLPSTFAPMSQTGLARLPGPAAGNPGIPSLQTLASRALALNSWSSQQAQALRAADLRYRRQMGGQEQTLAEALHQLAFAELAERGHALVIDTAALGEAGLTPSYLFPVPQASEETASENAASDEPVLGSLAALGLVFVPCPAGPLITTQEQLQFWLRLSQAYNESAPSSVSAALGEAVQHGHDSSGRFRTALNWLGHASQVPGPSANVVFLGELPTQDGLTNWTDWEVLAGPSDPGLLVVRAQLPSALGLLLAGVLLLSVFRVRPRPLRPGWRSATLTPLRSPPTPRRPLGLLLCCVGASGLAYFWLPLGLRDVAWWPLAAGAGVGLWWYLTPWRQAEQNGEAGHGGTPPTTPSVIQSAGLLALFWTMSLATPAAPPADTIPSPHVFLLPASDGEPASILLAPALRRELEARSKESAPALQPLILNAEYQGHLNEDRRTARLEAQFQLWTPEATSLELPFTGRMALLEEALLDGVRVPLQSLPKSGGYVLHLPAAGLHKVRLVFAIGVAVTGERFDLRFQAPRAGQVKLAIRLPKGIAYPQLLAKLGAQRVTLEENHVLLEAEVGALETTSPLPPTGATSMPIHVRWRSGRPLPEDAATVRYREAHLWDLGQRGHTLTSVIQYVVPSVRGVDQLIVEIPPELVVSRVDTRVPRQPPGTPPSEESDLPRLQAWGLVNPPGLKPEPGKPSTQLLQLDFQVPVTGEVELVLLLHPREGLFSAAPRDARSGAVATLVIPRPQGTSIPQGGALAYRLQGLEARPVAHLGLLGMAPRDFPAFFWEAVGKGELPLYAGRVLRDRERNSLVQLALSPLPARREGIVTQVWQLGPSQATLRAQIDLKAPDSDLALIELDLPAGLEINAVQGDTLRSWSLTREASNAGRLQIWLRRATGQTRCTVLASASLQRLPRTPNPLSLTGSALALAANNLQATARTLTVPLLRLRGVDTLNFTSQLEISAEEGFVLQPQRTRGLLVRSSDERFSTRLLYQILSSDAVCNLVVLPANLPSAQLMTRVDLREDQAHYEARVSIAAAELVTQEIRLSLTTWPGAKPTVMAPGATIRREPSSGTTQETWAIRWERLPTAATITVSENAALDRLLSLSERDLLSNSFSIPRLEIAGLRISEHRLRLEQSTPRFRPEWSQGSSQSGSELEEIPATATSGNSREWRLGSLPAHATLLLREQEAKLAGPARVVLQEQTTAAPDGQHWLSESTWWIFHESPTELWFALPENVTLLKLMVDDRDVRPQSGTTRDASESTVGLSLNGAGCRRVTIRWLLDEASLTRPPLQGPRLVNSHEGSLLATLHLPAGLEVGARTTFEGGALAGARLELSRAELALRMSRLLVETPNLNLPRQGPLQREQQLTMTQERFAYHARSVEQLLRSVPASRQVEELRGKIQALQQTNREWADKHGLAELRHVAEQRCQQEGLPHAIPSDWPVASLVVAGQPLYRLTPSADANRGEGSSPQLVFNSWVERRQALAASGLLIGLLVLIWMLSSFPALITLTRLFWPEQVVLLGLFGLQTFGPIWTVVFLLVLGASARLLSLGGSLIGLLTRTSRPAPTA